MLADIVGFALAAIGVLTVLAAVWVITGNGA